MQIGLMGLCFYYVKKKKRGSIENFVKKSTIIMGFFFSVQWFSRHRERDVAQSIACPPLKRSVVGSILLSGPSCSLSYFPFQPVVHNWFIKGRGMYCSVYGKVHIKDPLLLIEKSSLCGGSGFPSIKCVNVTI